MVRLEGTNVDNAKQIIAESGLAILSAENLDDAAKKAVTALNWTLLFNIYVFLQYLEPRCCTLSCDVEFDLIVAF